MKPSLPAEIDLGGRSYRVVREEQGGLLVADENGAFALLPAPEIAQLVLLDPGRLRPLGERRRSGLHRRSVDPSYDRVEELDE